MIPFAVGIWPLLETPMTRHLVLHYSSFEAGCNRCWKRLHDEKIKQMVREARKEVRR
jgi:hypothetical protein